MTTTADRLKIETLRGLVIGGELPTTIDHLSVTGLERRTDFQPMGEWDEKGGKVPSLVIFNSLFAETDITIAFGSEYKIAMEGSFVFSLKGGIDQNPSTISEYIDFLKTADMEFVLRGGNVEDGIRVEVYEQAALDDIQAIENTMFSHCGYSGDMIAQLEMGDWTAQAAAMLLGCKLNNVCPSLRFTDLHAELVAKVRAETIALLSRPIRPA